MRPSYLPSTPAKIIALVFGGVALVAAVLFFSFHDLEESDEHAVKSPAPVRMETQTSSRIDASTPTMPEPGTDSSPAQTKLETSPDSGATPGMDLAPPVGSEAPVPAVFGLLADSNVTNLPVAEGLQGIAEEFAEKVKQGGWDTTSEAYRTNWEKAAQEADDLLRARYGTEIYLKLKQNAAP